MAVLETYNIKWSDVLIKKKMIKKRKHVRLKDNPFSTK